MRERERESYEEKGGNSTRKYIEGHTAGRFLRFQCIAKCWGEQVDPLAQRTMGISLFFFVK